MRNRNSMVEVDREKLVKALEEKLKSEKNRIHLETIQFREDLKKARKQFLLNLEALTEFVAVGGDVPTDSYSLERIIKKGCNFPDEVKQREAEKIERALRKLSLVHTQTLMVGDDDEYLSLI